MLDVRSNGVEAIEGQAVFDSDDARAAQVIELYNTILNRNPDTSGFFHYLNLLRSGAKLSDLSETIRASPEAAAVAARNARPSKRFAWKAEDRPLVVANDFTVLQIELTNKCPFRCVMCPRTEHMTRHQGLMELPAFQKIIGELIAINPNYGKAKPPIWLHHFGESLVHPQFGDFIRYARTQGIRTRMSINPLMLSEGIGDDLLDADPAELQVSLDGHDDETFERIRGVAGAYEKSKRNLIRFLEKKVARGSAIHMTLAVIDFPMNDRTEEENRAEWERHWKSVPGIDAFLWKGFCSWNGDAPEIVAMNGNWASSPHQEFRHHQHRFKVTCDWPWKRIVVAWNGDVLSCCYDYDAKYVLGNVKTQTLTEIWNGGPMQALRREFASERVTNSLCTTCEYLRT
jgi:radical SAM protein with 4Fe4S-binding SPASM domain